MFRGYLKVSTIAIAPQISGAKKLASILACALVVACSSPNKSPDYSEPSSIVKRGDSPAAVKAAADQGDVYAMFLMGSGTGHRMGLSQDQSNSYLIKAAEEKNYFAQSQLIQLYRTGEFGFSKDYKKSIYWAQRVSCDHTSDHNSHLYLASLYEGAAYPTAEEKSLVKQDLALAYAHYELAHNGFLLTTSAERDALEKRMSPAELDRAHKLVDQFRNGGCPYGY